VNGDGRHPLYVQLTATEDSADGHVGDVRWNFEKFLVGRDGEVVGRFAPQVVPDDPAIVGAIESLLS
jgi:glutathione peroxidase